MMEGEDAIEEARSHMESFDTHVASLLSQSKDHHELASKVETLAETWQDVKRVLTAVLSAKDGEIRHLKHTLEKTEFEKTSAENFSKGLRDELRVVTSSLAQLRGNVMETSLQDGNSSEVKSLKLAEQSTEQTSLPLQGLAEGGGLGLLPSAKGKGLTPDQGKIPEQEELPCSTEPACSEELPCSTEPACSEELPCSTEPACSEELPCSTEPACSEELPCSTEPACLEELPCSEEEGTAGHTLQTGMELGQEGVLHSKEQGTPTLKTGMEPETDGIASQHGIGAVNASTQNPEEAESGLHCSDSQVPGQEAGMDVQEPAPGSQPVPSNGTEDASSDYQKIEFATLFYHRRTGYYYDPATQLFYSPVVSDQQYAQTTDQQVVQTASTEVAWSEYTSGVSSGTQTASTEVAWSEYTSGVSSGTQTASTEVAWSDQAGQTGGVAEMLAAASDRVVERCGLSYDDSAGMYYDGNLGLYYDPESKLYYDTERGTYYYYDPETRKYSIHSRVKLPTKQDQEPITRSSEPVINLCSSEEEFADSPEEGEIRPPKRRRPPKRPQLPHGSPPPEEEWDPCIRMIVSVSESLPQGTLFVVTQDGANIGREPAGPHGIKVPEVRVSKSHASITYNRRKQCFMVRDEGSTNGTFLDEKRLSEARESSKPRPLSHGHILTLGTTTFTLHIHTGWETCEECDPALVRSEEGRSGGGGGGGGGGGESLDFQRRRELNRIKKRYGLRAKDTYGEEEVQLADTYKDRASKRRKKVGSEPTEFYRPDDPPASVHRPLSDENRGHQMLVKMGWQKGQGLGKNNTGVAEPIQTELRTEKVGLGTSFSTQSLDSAATHSATRRHHRMMRHYLDVVSREEAKKSKPEKKEKSSIFME